MNPNVKIARCYKCNQTYYLPRNHTGIFCPDCLAIQEAENQALAKAVGAEIERVLRSVLAEWQATAKRGP